MKKIFPITNSIIVLFISLFVVHAWANAQASGQQDLTIDAATQKAVIESLIKELNYGYVFVDTAKKMEADLRNRLSTKEFESITSSTKFAEKLTADLRQISHDKHLGVRFSYETLPVRADRREPSAEEKARRNDYMRRINYGFDRVERMDGNIGYIELRGFMDPVAGKETVAAAFSLIANTDALIIDLRRNGGGDPEMVKLVCSYLFGDKPVHLNDLYFRVTNETTEFWTDPSVPGKKYLDKDIYVLTSNRTFSGGEEFANNLKVLKRASIIGETTGGGANPGGMVRLNDHFGVFVPGGRAINPITKTNWEGTGVEPNIQVSADQALKTAYLLALKKSAANEKNNDLRGQLQELIDSTQAELEKMKGTVKGK